MESPEKKAKTNRWARISLILGFLSMAAILVAHLALTDIHRGEGDLTAEWRALQICGLVVLSFHSVALATLARAAAGGRRSSTGRPRDAV